MKNTYLLLGLGFLLWMLFFDAEDLMTQYQLRRRLSSLQAEKAYYLKHIEKIEKDRKGLTYNEDVLEKFAREKYFMRKPTEDVYVIVED